MSETNNSVNDKDTVVQSHIRIVLLYTSLMNHFIIPNFDTHIYTVHSKILGYNTLSADWQRYKVVAVYANFTRRTFHDVTAKHIQVCTLATHVVLEIVGDVLQLHKLMQPRQPSQMSMKVG